jgi:hypothetical protein
MLMLLEWTQPGGCVFTILEMGAIEYTGKSIWCLVVQIGRESRR